MFSTRKISYGGTAAVVTSAALISGLSAAGATRPVVVSALLIAAIADNLTDALSIHIFQESEHLAKREALAGTVTNFLARLLLCSSFIPLVWIFPPSYVQTAGVVWGMSLLSVLTYFVARERRANVVAEILKHLVVAMAVITISRTAGHWISELLA